MMMMMTMTGRNLVGCGLMLAAGWLVAAAALAVPAMRIEPLCPVSD
ncbi:MAG: hypothetical protein RLZZ440_802, partial [Planctomycetota bacterium]